MSTKEEQQEFAFLMARNGTFSSLHDELVHSLIGTTHDEGVWTIVLALKYKIDELDNQKRQAQLRADLLLSPVFAEST